MAGKQDKRTRKKKVKREKRNGMRKGEIKNCPVTTVNSHAQDGNEEWKEKGE